MELPAARRLVNPLPPADRAAAGPIALVTGAAGGLGRATVRELLGAGYRVIATDMQPVEPLYAGVAGVTAEVADLTDAAGVAAMVERVCAGVGTPDLVACIAGVLDDRTIADLAPEAFRRTMRINLGGCYHVIRAVVPPMRRRGSGSIVTISTGLALIGHPSRADYVASKAAVIGLTRALARELGPAGIRVNAVAPGPLDTTMLQGFGRSTEYVSSLPLGRIGTPDEVARAIRQIGEAAWTTGQVYGPNGGAAIQ